MVQYRNGVPSPVFSTRNSTLRNTLVPMHQYIKANGYRSTVWHHSPSSINLYTDNLVDDFTPGTGTENGQATAGYVEQTLTINGQQVSYLKTTVTEQPYQFFPKTECQCGASGNFPGHIYHNTEITLGSKQPNWLDSCINSQATDSGAYTQDGGLTWKWDTIWMGGGVCINNSEVQTPITLLYVLLLTCLTDLYWAKHMRGRYPMNMVSTMSDGAAGMTFERDLPGHFSSSEAFQLSQLLQQLYTLDSSESLPSKAQRSLVNHMLFSIGNSVFVPPSHLS